MIRFIRKLLSNSRRMQGEYVGTFRTRDAAFTFRMNTGFPGDVNRTHPASIEPALVDPNAPPTAYGQAVLVDATTQGVRPFTAGDAAVTAAYGVTVRPYPIQQASGGMSSAFGAATPPTNQPIDVLKSGYILVSLNNFAVANAIKGGAVYVWCAATIANHVQGRFRGRGFRRQTPLLSRPTTNSYFNGPAGPDGVVELAFNL